MSDPDQWPEPTQFNPERFNTKDSENKWSKAADGKPRNPLSFTPFMGGKRICIGKTFAEVVVRFTIPMINHYCDFEFENPTEQAANKEYFSAGGFQDIKLPLKMTIRKDANL